MINFDYKLVREEGDEKKIYTPIIPKELEDLVMIEGPNSSGKSTLLNILALGFFGESDESIHPSLRKRIKNLVSSPHQKIAFKCHIKNEKSGLELRVEKPDPDKRDIDIYEVSNGENKRLIFENFREKYKLIYDVPDNPTERLNKLVDELKQNQKAIGGRIKTLSFYIREILDDLRKSRDPDKIKQYANDIKKQTKKIEDIKVTKRSCENDLLVLKRYAYTRLASEYLNRKILIEDKIKELKSKKRQIKSRRKEEDKEIKQFQEKAASAVSEIRNVIDEALRYLKILLPKDNFIPLWEKIDLRDALLDDSDSSTLKRGITHFQMEISDLKEKVEESPEIPVIDLYGQLIGVLKDYENLDHIIPGIEKSVRDLIKILEEPYKKYEDFKIRRDNIQNVEDKVDRLEELVDNFSDTYTLKLVKYVKKKGVEELREDKDDYFAHTQELDEEKDKLEDAERKFTFFRDECIKLDIKEKDIEKIRDEIERIEGIQAYKNFTGDQLEVRISSIEAEITGLKRNIDSLELNIKLLSREKADMEKRKPSKYQKHQGYLEGLFQVCQVLEQKFLNDFNNYLDLLSEGSVDIKHLNDFQAGYFGEVSKYLGRRLSTIRHIDKEFKVDTVDLVKSRIVTDSGKTIMFDDLGTGQSQAAYLKSLLVQSDRRKIIALFDEVAMMDTNSLEIVYKPLRELYKGGDLLVGIIVQKGDKIKVTPISKQ